MRWQSAKLKVRRQRRDEWWHWQPQAFFRSSSSARGGGNAAEVTYFALQSFAGAHASGEAGTSKS